CVAILLRRSRPSAGRLIDSRSNATRQMAHSLRKPMFVSRELGPKAIAVAVLFFATACQGQTQSPTPSLAPASSVRSPNPSPSPSRAAALPSPSPGLAFPSPSPSPSPLPSPPPTVVATTPLQIDDYPFAVMVDNIAEARPHFGLAD